MAYNLTVNGPMIMSVSSSGVQTPSGTYSFTRNSFSNSTYRKKPLGVSLITSPVQYSVYKQMRRMGVVTRQDGSSGPRLTNGATAPEGFDNETYQSGRKTAVYKLREKIKGEDWNLGTFLGELPETLKYFGNTLNTVVRTYRSVKKGDLREVRQLRKYYREKVRPHVTHENTQAVVSGKWLEWRYAIQPLMYDLDDALKALYNSRTRPMYTRAVAGAGLKFRDQTSRQSGQAKWVELRQHSMALRLGVYYKVNPTVDSFKRLGLLNPVATLWELFPLSFVVDWFIPIGTYLGSLDAMAGVQVVSSWESRTSKTEYTSTGYNYVVYNMNGTVNSAESVTPSESWKESYDRFLAPSLGVPLPVFTLSVNSKRFLDGLSLTRLILLSGK